MRKEDSSFLKKRSKKLLLTWALRSRRRLARHQNSKSLFASFSSEKEESFLFVFLTALLFSGHAHGDAATVARGQVPYQNGAEIYRHVCQGCHMPGGRGAAGAGTFPTLANNPHLAEAGYPVSMVLNGHGGMPWFNGTLTPAQIAAVVSFVRTHFGNAYPDAVTAAFVAGAAGPVPNLER